MKQLGFLILVLSMIQISCEKNDDIDGNICEYIKYEGIAKIKLISIAPSDEYNCPNEPKKIKFEFTPDNISDRDQYNYTNYNDSANYMRINAGMNPSQLWIDNNKIEIGKEYKCFRTEIKKGTCTPVIFEFPDLDLFPSNGCD
ncbi:MAG: hypothetical protein KAQ75_06940 [Bacteroidales bacterium]|nr:hypothetical protein [Bacteroidales bacterium]